ncbi:MAG: FAD-binding oxidoreductase [Armatimonadota bacterium]|nr:FAD-binding oxidoreductase [Armatimonadota bacterium]
MSRPHNDPSSCTDLQQALARRLPGRVLTDPEELARYAADALAAARAYRSGFQAEALPAAVVRATTVDDVCRLLEWAHEEGVPVVPFGGGSGVMGGAVAVAGAVTLDLRGLNRIRRVSREDRTVEAEAGVLLSDLGEALDPHGLFFAHDPWSVHVATVGGAISTNGAGYRVGGYGRMADQVLGLEVVLAGGRLVRTPSVPAPGPGPELHRLFCGSEGTLGVVTAAVLRAWPKPEAERLVALRFRRFEDAWAWVVALVEARLQPAVLDVGEEPGSGEAAPGGFRTETTAYVGFDGPREVVEAAVDRCLRIAEKQAAQRLPDEDAAGFWRTRHQPGREFARRVRAQPDARVRARWGRLFDYLCVSLPASGVLEFRRLAFERLSREGYRLAEFGLWGCPELVSVAYADPDGDPAAEADRRRLAEVSDWLLRRALRAGGGLEYCHGAGVKLRHLVPEALGTGLDVLRGIKQALDPKGILNPGKLL